MYDLLQTLTGHVCNLKKELAHFDIQDITFVTTMQQSDQLVALTQTH